MRGRRIKDIAGMRFGKLTVIEFKFLDSHGAQWLCRCDCGNERVIRSSSLSMGLTRSCGCIRFDSSFPHTNRRKGANNGPSSTKEYRSWLSMKARCYNPATGYYYNYGGRGIKVCDSWLASFENFMSDMGKAPSNNHSLDRIDNNGNYDPSNCRWATRYEQNINKRNTIRLTLYNETKTLVEWCSKYKIGYHIALWRFHNGWPSDQIFTQ